MSPPVRGSNVVRRVPLRAPASVPVVIGGGANSVLLDMVESDIDPPELALASAWLFR